MPHPQKDAGEKLVATNRKAFFNYEVIERVEAGVVLAGSEVKSIRQGGFNFSDSYVKFDKGEMWLVACRIGPYSHANQSNHLELRDRKLLLKKREILKLGGRATEKGFTLVPLRAYFKDNRFKLEIGLARGKQQHDKRAALRKKDIDRETRAALSARR